MRIFFSVGEPSGDLHGANLVRKLRALNPQVECVGFGGPKMAREGCELLADLTQLAVMFLSSVIKNYRKFKRHLKEAEDYFRQHHVDAVVLIDYPGFNWLIAKRARKHGIPVFYYGVPQMWAWAPWRIHKLKRLVDYVLCKLPFEPKWFRDRDVAAEFVGHPFYDELARCRHDEDFCDQFRVRSGQTLLLLPGSRDSEVEKHWPWLRDAACLAKEKIPGLNVAIGCFRESHLQKIEADLTARGLTFEAFVKRTPELMLVADACIACSGSVSLELMYYQLPSVIVYRLNRAIYFLQRFLLRVRYITLVNLMACDSIERTGWKTYDPDEPNAEAVPLPEYLSSFDRVEPVANRIIDWLMDEGERQKARNWLGALKQEFAITGATDRAASFILSTLGKKAENSNCNRDAA